MEASVIQRLDFQPHFPTEDLTDANADFISLMLASQKFFQEEHIRAEKLSRLFTYAHPTVVGGFRSRDCSADILKVVSRGAAAFEVIYLMTHCGLVPETHFDSDGSAKRECINATLPLDYEYIADTLPEEFYHDMPKTAEIIKNTVPEDHRYYIRYALAGAALARMTEMDVTQRSA